MKPSLGRYFNMTLLTLMFEFVFFAGLPSAWASRYDHSIYDDTRAACSGFVASDYMRGVAVVNFPQSPGFVGYVKKIERESYLKAKQNDYSDSEILSVLLNSDGFKRAVADCFPPNSNKANEINARLFSRNLKFIDHLGATRAGVERGLPIAGTLLACWLSGGTSLGASAIAMALRGLSKLSLALVILEFPKSTESPPPEIQSPPPRVAEELKRERLQAASNLEKSIARLQKRSFDLKAALSGSTNDRENASIKSSIDSYDAAISESQITLSKLRASIASLN